MADRGRILVIEDCEDWQETLAAILRKAGFDAEVATSFDDAVSRLSSTPFHLAIVDLRLIDGNEMDVGGMNVLDELKRLGLSEALEKIMISAYGTPELLREAFKEHGVADFILKEKFDRAEFLQIVQDVFAQKVQANFDLNIILEDGLSYEELATSVALGGTRLRKNDERFTRVMTELVDLFRRLFHEASTIVVRRASRGHGKTGVAKVEPYYAGSHGEPVIVKYGEYEEIDQEFKNYRAYVRGFVGGARATNVLDLRRTPLLGGIIYSLIGTQVDRVVDFATFYAAHPSEEIEDILDDLFKVTCANWYSERGSVQHCRLSEEYARFLRFSPEKLEVALKDNFPSFLNQKTLTLHDLPGTTFSNPVYATRDWSFSQSTFLSATHGDLNANNIVIDDDGHTWLIDFYRTGKSHILRDCIELESVVKFVLLKSEGLRDRCQLERVLLTMDRFSDAGSLHYDAPNEEYTKAFATVRKLRQLAAELVHPYDDFVEYEVGLLYYSLNLQRFYSIPKVNRLHAFMTAGMLCEKLGL